MKKQKLLLLIPAAALLLAAVILLLRGGRGGLDCPFTDTAWTTTPGALTAALGEAQEVYASVYGGDTYVYAGDYLGCHGSIKYMYAGDGTLASMAWSAAGTPSEIGALSARIAEAETKLHGRSDTAPQGSGANGWVWYLRDGDVLVTSVTVSGSSALQYAYIAREHSYRQGGRS